MIRFARKDDFARIQILWEAVFGDSPDNIDAFLSAHFSVDAGLLFLEGGALCGMLWMLPLTLISGNMEYPARYVYAVATDPAFRGRGIATDLIERAHDVMAACGEAASLLVPASESLFGYYAKRGYRTAFSIDVAEFGASALESFPADGTSGPCAPRAFAQIRDAAFSGSSLYARWDEGAVAYACAGMSLTRLARGDGVGCALWEQDGDGVLVRELALLGMRVSDAMAILHRTVGASSYRVRLPGGDMPFGMIKWLIPEPRGARGPGYLSLALD